MQRTLIIFKLMQNLNIKICMLIVKVKFRNLKLKLIICNKQRMSTRNRYKN